MFYQLERTKNSDCHELGSEWRLPRIEEFKKIWPYKILSEVLVPFTIGVLMTPRDTMIKLLCSISEKAFM